MPKHGVPQSRRRRAERDAEDEAKRPTESGTARSVLANHLRKPTERTETELIRAASNGELTTHDITAGIAAQIIAARKLLPAAGRRMTPENQLLAAKAADLQRPVHVLLKQLIEGMRDIVVEKGGGGPLLIVELHWPEKYAGHDKGEDVRLRAPEAKP